MIVKLLTEHHLESLSLKAGCRGSSEPTHVKYQIVGNLTPRLNYYSNTLSATTKLLTRQEKLCKENSPRSDCSSDHVFAFFSKLLINKLGCDRLDY